MSNNYRLILMQKIDKRRKRDPPEDDMKWNKICSMKMKGSCIFLFRYVCFLLVCFFFICVSSTLVSVMCFLNSCQGGVCVVSCLHWPSALSSFFAACSASRWPVVAEWVVIKITVCLCQGPRDLDADRPREGCGLVEPGGAHVRHADWLRESCTCTL